MLTYPMNQRDEKTKYYYLYTALKEDILTGVLKKNEKLPSKRALAEHLGISLITVETAYQMLKDEGYIESRERSGYYVTELKLLGKKVNYFSRVLQDFCERCHFARLLNLLPIRNDSSNLEIYLT